MLDAYFERVKKTFNQKYLKLILSDYIFLAFSGSQPLLQGPSGLFMSRHEELPNKSKYYPDFRLKINCVFKLEFFSNNSRDLEKLTLERQVFKG